MINRKYLPLFLLFLTLLLALSGCVGKREINELAMVMAVGIDKGEKEKIRVTIQVPRPADARGQTGAPAGNTGDPIWSAYGEGETIFAAIRDLSSFSSRRVFWAHNFAIVISEEFAKEGIDDIIDFFTRNPELRMNTWVVVTPNKASEIVTTMTGLEIIPGEVIDDLFYYSPISSKAPQTHMLYLQSTYLSHTQQPVLGRIKIIEKGASNKEPGKAKPVKQVQLAGAGVFRGDKLVGILNEEETMGFLPFVQKVESRELPLICRNGEKRITGEVTNKKIRITPYFKDGKPSFKIKMDTTVRIVEAGCSFSMKNQTQVKDLEKQIERQMKKEITNLLTKIKKDYKSDILGLEKEFKNKYPAEWKKNHKQWDGEFYQIPAVVEVNTKINEASLIFEPTKPNQEKKM